MEYCFIEQFILYGQAIGSEPTFLVRHTVLICKQFMHIWKKKRWNTDYLIWFWKHMSMLQFGHVNLHQYGVDTQPKLVFGITALSMLSFHMAM